MARPILSASFVIFFAYTGQFMAYPIIPFYIIRELGGSPIDVGLVLFSNMLMAAIFSVPMGALSDRWGRRKVIFIGAVLATVGHVLIPFTQTSFELMIVFSLAGLGHAAYGPGVTAFVGDVVTRKDAARGFSWSQISRNIAISIGPAIGGFIAVIYSLSTSFFICALFLLVGSIVTLAVIPARNLVKAGGEQDARQDLPSKEGGMRNVLKDLAIMSVMMSTFAFSFAVLAYRGFIPLFAENMGGSPILDLGLPAYIGILFTVQAIASTLARLPLAKYSDKTGIRAPFVIIGLAVTALTFFLIITFQDLTLLLIWSAMLGFAGAMGPAAGAVILTERAGVKARGAIFGLNNTSLYAGQAIGSIVMGAIVQGYGFEEGFGTVLALLVVSALAFFILAKKLKLR